MNSSEAGIINDKSVMRSNTTIFEELHSIIRLQEEKNEALKNTMDMKDEFISLISHEFKTPLTVINSAIQMLDTFCRHELSDRAKGYIDKIRLNTYRQMKLVNNLLDITRIKAGKLKLSMTDTDIVPLTASITESIRIFAEQKKIELSYVSVLKKKIIGIDVEKYERILLNLLSNAIKYTPEGRSITVRLSKRINGRESKACIQVCDNGIGIPADKQELIFDRFGQVDDSLSRQAEGTGIGLYLTRMFVEMLGGEIKVESRPGEGSTFTVLLPFTNRSAVQANHEICDKRLSRTASIEFSDIYI